MLKQKKKNTSITKAKLRSVYSKSLDNESEIKSDYQSELKKFLSSVKTYKYFSNKKLDALFREYLFSKFIIEDKLVEKMFPAYKKRFPEITKEYFTLYSYVVCIENVLTDSLYVDALSKYKNEINVAGKRLLEIKIKEIIEDDLMAIKEYEDDELRHNLIARMEISRIDDLLTQEKEHSELISKYNLLPKGNTKDRRKRKTDECKRVFIELNYVKLECDNESLSWIYDRIIRGFLFWDKEKKQPKKELLSYSRLCAWKDNRANKKLIDEILASLIKNESKIKEYKKLIEKAHRGILI